MKKHIIFISALLFFCFFRLAPSAQTADEPVNISGSSIWGNTDKKVTYIEGNVRISQGKTVITTNKAELNLDKKTALLNQGVQLSNQDVIIKAGSLDYDIKKKLGTFTDKVVLQQIEAKTNSDTERKEPFKLTSGELYFEANTKNFTAKNNAAIENKDFTGTADIIDYSDKEQKIVFTGNVKIAQGSTVLTTNAAEIDLDNKRLLFNEHIKSVSNDTNIEADRLDYDYNKKTGVFEKNVVLNRAAAKNDPGKETQDPFKLTTDNLYFETDTKNFTAKDKAAIENKDFNATADTIEYKDKEQVLEFKGNTKIAQGTTVLTTDAAKIDLNKKRLLFENNIKSVSDNINIDAGGLDYNYNKKTGLFTKNVVLNRDAAKADKNKEAQDPFKLTADELYFESDTKNFTAKYNGVIEHKDFNGGGDLIEYNDKLQQLSFEDNAYLNRPEGDQIKGDLIVIDLREKNFTIRNNASVSIELNDNSGEQK